MPRWLWRSSDSPGNCSLLPSPRTREEISSFHWRSQRRKRENNSNYCAAFFHMLSVALFCMSLARLGWFRVESLYCSQHIAGYQFLSNGQFDMKAVPKFNGINSHKFEGITNLAAENGMLRNSHSPVWISQFSTFGKVLSCVTPFIAVVMRIILALCFFGIICALCAFFIDICGSRNPKIRMLQANAVPGVLAVLTCIGAIGFSSYVTVLLHKEASQISEWEPYVTFDYGYYVLAAAGFLSLIGTAFDMLLSRHTRKAARQRRAHRVRLMDNWDNEDTVYPDITYPSHLTPPPPYTP